METIHNNQEFLTYSELISAVSSEIQKQINTEKERHVFYSGMEKFTIVNLNIFNIFLKLLKKTTPYIAIGMSAATFFGDQNTSNIMLNLVKPLIAGFTIHGILSSETLKNATCDAINYRLVSLEENKNIHNKRKLLHMHQKSNINLPVEQLFCTLLTAKEQHSFTFTREWVKIMMDLLKSFSLTSITFSIALRNVSRLQTINSSSDKVGRINELSEASFENIIHSLDTHKQKCRNEFNANFSISTPYNKYNILPSSDTNSLSYFEILKGIEDRIDNEIIIAEKKVKEYNKRIAKYQIKLANTSNSVEWQNINQTLQKLMSDKALLENKIKVLKTKKNNLNNWFSSCSDILKSNELLLKLPSKIESIIYSLLSYYGISTITLCLFEGKLDLLASLVQTTNSNAISYINSLTDKTLSDYHNLKNASLTRERQRYERRLQDILTSHKSI